MSFARSHTLTTFDDSVMPAAVGGSRFRRDCERLIDGRAVKVMYLYWLTKLDTVIKQVQEFFFSAPSIFLAKSSRNQLHNMFIHFLKLKC